MSMAHFFYKYEFTPLYGHNFNYSNDYIIIAGWAKVNWKK